jgi:hypothetical protein
VVGNPNPHPLKSFSIGRFCASEAGLAGSPSLFIYWRDFAKNKEKKRFKKKKASKLENQVGFQSLTSIARSEGGVIFLNSHIYSFGFLYVARNIEG